MAWTIEFERRAGQEDAAHIHIGIDRIAGGGEGIAVALLPERVHRLRTFESKGGDVVRGSNLEQKYAQKYGSTAHNLP